MANQLPLPAEEAIAGSLGIRGPWLEYFGAVGALVNQAPNRVVPPTSLTAQQASIGATSLLPATFPAGLYRLSYYTRITVPADTTSTLTVTFAWTDHGQAMTTSGAAITGNTVTTFQSDSLFIYSDANVSPTYATTYGFTAVTPMQHSLYITIEAVAI